MRWATLFAWLLVAPMAPVRAGQPLVTEDAAVVAPKTCQLEAWTSPSSDGNDYWMQPACNFTGALEISFGVGRLRPDTDGPSSSILLQAKTATGPNNAGWSFGAVGGAIRDTGASRGRSAYQTYYAKFLASWYPRDDLEIDLNLGLANDYDGGTFSLAGAAVQYAVVAHVQLLTEVLHDEPGSAKYQVGLRWIVVPDRFEAYVSYGSRFSDPTHTWSTVIGVRLQSPAFLP